MSGRSFRHEPRGAVNRLHLRGRRLPAADGQATVELVAVLPVIVALALGAWQAAVAGHAIWSASAAARSASRVVAVGGDAEKVVRRLAGERARLREVADGGVRVTVPIPLVAGEGVLTMFSTTARFEPQG